MQVPLATVCRVTGAARSTIYHRRASGEARSACPGPKTDMSDEVLTETIRRVITECPFAGEGHRKIRARLRREHDMFVGKNRVLRLMHPPDSWRRSGPSGAAVRERTTDG